MEREAYDRARAFDTETIARQDREIEELRSEMADLKDQLRNKDREIHDLRNRIFILEHVGPLTIHYEPPDLEVEESDDHEPKRHPDG
jgi:predicted RNase H-like nuclease (RuvC/YqgF family)